MWTWGKRRTRLGIYIRGLAGQRYETLNVRSKEGKKEGSLWRGVVLRMGQRWGCSLSRARAEHDVLGRSLDIHIQQDVLREQGGNGSNKAPDWGWEAHIPVCIRSSSALRSALARPAEERPRNRANSTRPAKDGSRRVQSLFPHARSDFEGRAKTSRDR